MHYCLPLFPSLNPPIISKRLELKNNQPTAIKSRVILNKKPNWGHLDAIISAGSDLYSSTSSTGAWNRDDADSLFHWFGLRPSGSSSTYLCFLKELMLQQFWGCRPEKQQNDNKWLLFMWAFILKLGNVVQDLKYRHYNQHLFSGSFCRHREIIFLKDLPYFFTISLSVMPVSRAGGSFCSVSIKTWRQQEHI